MMTFSRITACLTVEESDEAIVLEALNSAIDHLAISRMPIFESDIKAVPVCHVENAEAVREEALRPSSQNSSSS